MTRVAGVGTATTNYLHKLLASSTGLASGLAEVTQGEHLNLAVIGPQQILMQNVAFDVVERGSGTRYPAVYVYCDRVTNTMREKFRTFSGKARMVVEIRVSHDRLEGLEKQLQVYADAAVRVLDNHRGDWGGGMYYAGGYEITFGAVKRGGKNYIQAAKVEFEVEGSIR